jgi:hypothetical protein
VWVAGEAVRSILALWQGRWRQDPARPDAQAHMTFTAILQYLPTAWLHSFTVDSAALSASAIHSIDSFSNSYLGKEIALPGSSKIVCQYILPSTVRVATHIRVFKNQRVKNGAVVCGVLIACTSKYISVLLVAK